MSYENILLVLFFLLTIIFGAVFIFCIRQRPDSRRYRELLRLLTANIMLFVSLLFLVLFGGELYYRYWYDQSDSFTLTRTGKDWFKKHYHLNSWGLRDSVDYSYEKVPGKTRITFLGDSFTAGHGVPDVEKRFANRIRALRSGWEVHVLTKNGVDSIHELEFLGDAPPEYRFETVVLVYMLNDISKIMPEWQRTIDTIYSEEPTFLINQSYFLNTLYFRWKRTRIPGVMSFYRFTLSAYENATIWEKQQAILKSIKKLVKARGGSLMVVTFPFLHSLGQNYEFHNVHKQLAAFWADQNVPHLDLIDLFQSHLLEKLTINPYDAHPNERAHALAAEAIMTFLDNQLTSTAK